jgi:hypothetical protein
VVARVRSPGARPPCPVRPIRTVAGGPRPHTSSSHTRSPTVAPRTALARHERCVACARGAAPQACMSRGLDGSNRPGLPRRPVQPRRRGGLHALPRGAVRAGRRCCRVLAVPPRALQPTWPSCLHPTLCIRPRASRRVGAGVPHPWRRVLARCRGQRQRGRPLCAGAVGWRYLRPAARVSYTGHRYPAGTAGAWSSWRTAAHFA